MTEDAKAIKKPKTLGDKVLFVGVAMFSISIILALVGVSGALFHNIMQIGGFALALIGVIMRRELKK
jgi:uncharacterized membrane protein